MASVVQNLIERSLGDGARASKFECYINFQSNLFSSKDDLLMLVKTSNFPGKTHVPVDFKYRGQTLPLKGQTTYDNTWACTFYLTQDHSLKKAFEDWIESIDQKNNIKKVSSSVELSQDYNNKNGYTTSMQIAQMDFHGTKQAIVYEMYNVFPKSVSSVEVDYSNTGAVLEFTVEFSYSYFDSTVVDVASGTLMDDLKDKVQNIISDVVGSTKQQLTTLFKTTTGSLSESSIGRDTKEFAASDMGSRLE